MPDLTVLWFGVYAATVRGSRMSEDKQNEQGIGSYIALGVALGTGIGVALGAAFGNVALGVAFGTGIGIALAMAFCSAKASDRASKGDR